ncbi:aldehyde-activating protein [Defluviimonas sp. 20V17]|uniref:Aldehyde-activating protein n=1 Tax=Allgaiera indica TaxID=765699 RepID=A0AAN4UPW0_9RHOB|nr:GFA family protein [Allgaiera indica]KDB03257.1 aldehyde-activating protein [Defluviimonas sp. 20V17]GHE00541.1 aldehyde-activating protein [Allgaiera indica]SDW60085.1 Uncharacterized conserved protein [Allgaiera indica]
MTPPKPPFEGACLCGAVRVRVTAPPLLTLACHCRDCQKLTASAYSLTTMFPMDGFFLTGEVIRGGLCSHGRRHFFCKSCLNFIFSEITGADQRVNLRTSVLENAAAFTPFVELMTEDKMPWAQVPAAFSFARFPQTAEDLQALMDAYAKQ